MIDREIDRLMKMLVRESPVMPYPVIKRAFICFPPIMEADFIVGFLTEREEWIPACGGMTKKEAFRKARGNDKRRKTL